MNNKKITLIAIAALAVMALPAQVPQGVIDGILEDCPESVGAAYARNLPRYAKALPEKKADPVQTLKAVVPRACYLELQDWQMQTALQLGHFGLNQGLKPETISDLTEMLSWQAIAKESYVRLGRVYERMQKAGAGNEEIAEVFFAAQSEYLLPDQAEGFALIYAESRSAGKTHDDSLSAAKAELKALKKIRGDKLVLAHVASLSIIPQGRSGAGDAQNNDALWDALENAIAQGPSAPVKLPEADKKRGWNAERLQEFFGKWKGTPYKWGGVTKKGIDCSGFVIKAIESQFPGTKYPRSARDLASQGSEVKAGSLMPGDLVFFAASGVAGKITHVGIYLNDRQFAHASSKRGVTLNSIDDKYYTKRFVTARRLF